MATTRTGFLDWLGGTRNIISILIALGMVASPVCWAIYQVTQNEKDIQEVNKCVDELDADIGIIREDMKSYMKDSILSMREVRDSIQELDKKIVRIGTRQEGLIEDVREQKNER